ncbi:MFS transporter [Neomoorella thermoacetica]|uniref:MFS transporter n=1 Tax=Neomoorella thermoacetica TaxID=1525 RepID=UPI0008FBAA87|nr:MFS transporter [Moorella thermoacetica]OIQ54819.1 major facilitator superfamily protein [Moorella thermoacetica]
MSDVDKLALSPYRWVVLVVAMLAAFIGSYAQFQLPPLAYKLIPAMHISSSQFAALMGGPMTGSIFICLLGGILADRYGVKNVVTVGLVLEVIGCTFRFATMSFWPFFFLTVLCGIASALLTSNLAKLFGAWFPMEQLGTIIGIYMISPSLAMFTGTATTALFPSMASAFITSGVICLVILVAWVALAKNKPDGAPDMPVMPATKYLGVAVKSSGVWLASFAILLAWAAIMTFNDFLPNALHAVRGISPVEAGIIGSLVTLGGAFGSWLGPVICNRVGTMKPFLIVCSLLAAAGLMWAWQMPVGAPIIIGLMLTGFFMNATGGPILSLPMLLPEIGPVYAGSAGGIIATMMVLGAVLVPTFIITPLAGTNMIMMFGLAALSFALSVIPVLFLKELGRKALEAKARQGGEGISD